MKRLIIFALLAFAGWYGWKHYDQILHPKPRHFAVVRNDSGEKLVRIRLTVGGQTYVKEELPDGQTATFPFSVDSDSQFDLAWEYDARMNTGHWMGGLVAKGPLVGRHIMTIGEGGGVVYTTQPI